MTMPVFPTLAGQGWSVYRRLLTSTKIAKHVSGREVRTAMWANPLYNFEVTYEGLRNGFAFPNLGDVDALQAFIASLGGPFLPFLYVDPSANTAMASVIGIGDGVTTQFPLLRTVGRIYSGPIDYATALTAVRVYPVENDFGHVANDPVSSTIDYQAASGVLDLGNVTPAPFTTPTYTLINSNAVLFATAPAAGSVIQADFTYAFMCRFDEDTAEFENVMSGLWQMQSLKFSTFR